MTPEARYLQIGALVAEMPDLNVRAPVPPEVNAWLGRAYVLVNEILGLGEAISVKSASVGIGGPSSQMYVQAISSAVYRALAHAEQSAPSRLQGSFIAAGHELDAYLAVGSAIGAASRDILFIDPYSDEKLLEFALQAQEQITIHILADEKSHKPSLRPAVTRWNAQFGAARPLEARLAPSRSLHDRAIIVDQSTVFTVGQSFNALAARSPTTLVRLNDLESIRLKLEAYEAIWSAASPLLAR